MSVFFFFNYILRPTLLDVQILWTLAPIPIIVFKVVKPILTQIKSYKYVYVK